MCMKGNKQIIAPSPSEIFYQHSELSAPLTDCKNKVFEMQQKRISRVDINRKQEMLQTYYAQNNVYVSVQPLASPTLTPS